MADAIIEKITAEAEGEEAVFLNDIVTQLWPNINVAGSQMIKEIADPMFKQMLPGPLASLHFTKIDLGTVPIRISKVAATKTETKGINLEMNVEWDGKCDVTLDGGMIPELGVKSVQLKGRLSVLLCPLTNVIPLIGAAQFSFINPPLLKLDFTGAAQVADLSLIDGAVRRVILNIISSMAVLPNRYLYKLDVNNDYFKTYLYPLGMLRVTVEKAYGFAEQAKSSAKKLFSKITRAAPDTYVKCRVGAEPERKTSVKDNTTTPAWNETYDFVVSDLDQIVELNVLDDDVGEDDEVGIAITTVRDILAVGGKQELPLMNKGQETGGKLAVSCQYFELVPEATSFSESEHSSDGTMGGIATILIASAFDVKGERSKLKPSVKITWGEKHHFQTVVQSDYPGTDINNPSFDQPFRLPVTPDLVGKSFRLVLLDGEKEVGAADVPYEDVVKAEHMTFQGKLDVGGGTAVRASIRLQGVKAASIQEAVLPERQKQ
ncbi:hypothetical protein EJ03DRAFT_276486 [Teratosphaeria nubilosa]|uniref:C2 domain-containing protein n=1 Tax=Teratosphaeria nubilosa TaxID=161662 RepID=A0A6G1L308_9PEZI|nr:hypothetical protein EJ03DRAFT_276486 [Teratosphaeria nubilosa]